MQQVDVSKLGSDDDRRPDQRRVEPSTTAAMAMRVSVRRSIAEAHAESTVPRTLNSPLTITKHADVYVLGLSHASWWAYTPVGKGVLPWMYLPEGAPHAHTAMPVVAPHAGTPKHDLGACGAKPAYLRVNSRAPRTRFSPSTNSSPRRSPTNTDVHPGRAGLDQRETGVVVHSLSTAARS